MEIGALSSTLATSYAPRVAQADTVDRQRQVARDVTAVTRGQERGNNDATMVAKDAAEARRKETRDARETQAVKDPTPVADPRVQFKDSEGTRVMEVYDSKNILIYQVPPKGALTLIHNQEKRADTQVETSA